jgi:hypothetical protein
MRGMIRVMRALLAVAAAQELACGASDAESRAQPAAAPADSLVTSRLELPPPAASIAASSSSHAENRSRDEEPNRPLLLHTESGRDVRVVLGASISPTSPLILITALHGKCYVGEDLCTLLRPLADGRGVLVCPKGNGACDDGSPDWIIPTSATVVKEAMSTAETALGAKADPKRGVLIGSSRGAYAACQIINDTPDGPWSGLVLIGASVDPDPERLRLGGIRRIILAAPEFDVAAPAMQKARDKLCRAGLPTRFIDLGAHGHGVPAEGPAILAQSMDWVMETSETNECAKKPASQ